jgi:hypothetical protein
MRIARCGNAVGETFCRRLLHESDGYKRRVARREGVRAVGHHLDRLSMVSIVEWMYYFTNSINYPLHLIIAIFGGLLVSSLASATRFELSHRTPRTNIPRS